MCEVLATEKDIHEVEKRIAETGFYDPSMWQTRYLGKWIMPTRVEFDEDEERMLKEMADKTGYPKSEIARMAVHDAYFRIIIGGGVGGIR